MTLSWKLRMFEFYCWHNQGLQTNSKEETWDGDIWAQKSFSWESCICVLALQSQIMWEQVK